MYMIKIYVYSKINFKRVITNSSSISVFLDTLIQPIGTPTQLICIKTHPNTSVPNTYYHL